MASWTDHGLMNATRFIRWRVSRFPIMMIAHDQDVKKKKGTKTYGYRNVMRHFKKKKKRHICTKTYVAMSSSPEKIRKEKKKKTFKGGYSHVNGPCTVTRIVD